METAKLQEQPSWPYVCEHFGLDTNFQYTDAQREEYFQLLSQAAAGQDTPGVDRKMPETIVEEREVIRVTVELDVHEPAAFRKAAYERALKDGLDKEQAAEYLDPEKMSLGQCGIMIIDPGVSPDGAQIENSNAE